MRELDVELSLFQDALDDQLAVLRRRLSRTGTGHFAASRFDAIENLNSRLLRSVLPGSLQQGRADERRALLASLARSHPSLDSGQRAARTRARTDAIVSELVNVAGPLVVALLELDANAESEAVYDGGPIQLKWNAGS